MAQESEAAVDNLDTEPEDGVVSQIHRQKKIK
jgi:hypothetical protein